MAAAAGEGADREHAVVLAALAARGGGLVRELFDLCEREHRALLAVIAVAREQRRAERAHDARNVGTRDLRAGDALERAQYGLVEKRAALHDDMRAELARVGELDDLIKGIFDDGVGKTGGDIGDACALLLRLLDVGVHKHRAARTEVHGGPGEERLARELLRRHAEGVGEVFKERAAAGRAGFVQEHRVHRAALELDALHVLPADIEHAVHLRVEERRGGAVGDGLHLALVEREGGFEQRFTVACGAGARDMRARRQLPAQLAHGLHGGLDGIALIVRVERVQKLALFANERELCRCRARVKAEEAVSLIRREAAARHDRRAVTGAEGFKIGFVFKERRQALEFKVHLHAALQPRDQCIERLDGRGGPVDRCAHGGEKVGIFRVDGRFLRQLQRADERRLELGQEVQRTAQECHVSADGLAAGKPRDRLIHDRLKDRGGKVGLRCTLVDEGLNVRLGEHAAARGNGVDLFVMCGLAVETRGVGLQQGGHLVDKRARTARAHAIHALLKRRTEVNDLRVLAAKLNGDVHLRRGALERLRHRHDLLYERHAERTGKVDRARACGTQRERAFAERLARLAQQRRERALRVGQMAAILPEEHLPVFIQHDELDRGGTHVDACLICSHRVLSFRSCRWRGKSPAAE